jgi:hypothetical protein
VNKSLIKKGVKEGDTVIVGEVIFLVMDLTFDFLIIHGRVDMYGSSALYFLSDGDDLA